MDIVATYQIIFVQTNDNRWQAVTSLPDGTPHNQIRVVRIDGDVVPVWPELSLQEFEVDQYKYLPAPAVGNVYLYDPNIHGTQSGWLPHPASPARPPLRLAESPASASKKSWLSILVRCLRFFQSK